MGRAKKKRTVKVPDGEGWTRDVEVPNDEPPRRYSQNVQDMNAYMLKHELGQLKIDFECGPGPTVRQRLELREKDIHRELARRNALADDVLEREVARRDKLKPSAKLIADAVVEVKLGTEHVRTKLTWFAEQCLVGPESQFKSVDELVYKLQEQVEQWVEIIEDQ
jgi:hypothetical protein